MIELYYAEDDPDIAEIVKEYLEQKNFKVTIFPTIAQLQQKLKIQLPSILLLDWNMPDGHGDGLCRQIRSFSEKLPIIFLTVRSDSRDMISGFHSGADDYVVKPFELEVLYSRISALLRRSGTIAPQTLSCGGISLDLNRRLVFYHSQEVELTITEYQLLLYLMQSKGRTLTREKLLEQIWDLNGSYVNNNTLTVTMKRLRDKLHQPPCLKTIRSVGYRMEDTI